MEDLWYGKPMSYWHAIARRISEDENAYAIESLLLENRTLHAQVGIYEERIKTLITAFHMFNNPNHSES